MSVVVTSLGHNKYLIRHTSNQIVSPSNVVINYPSPNAKLLYRRLLSNFNTTGDIVTTDLDTLLKLVTTINESILNTYDDNLDFNLTFSSTPPTKTISDRKYYGVTVVGTLATISIPTDFGTWSWSNDVYDDSELRCLLESCGYVDLMIRFKSNEVFKFYYGHVLNVTYEKEWFRGLIVDALHRNNNYHHVKYMLDLNYLIQSIYGAHLTVCHHYTDPYRLTIGVIDSSGNVTLPEFKHLMSQYKLTPTPVLTENVVMEHHSIPQDLIDLITEYGLAPN